MYSINFSARRWIYSQLWCEWRYVYGLPLLYCIPGAGGCWVGRKPRCQLHLQVCWSCYTHEARYITQYTAGWSFWSTRGNIWPLAHCQCLKRAIGAARNKNTLWTALIFRCIPQANIYHQHAALWTFLVRLRDDRPPSAPWTSVNKYVGQLCMVAMPKDAWRASLRLAIVSSGFENPTHLSPLHQLLTCWLIH